MSDKISRLFKSIEQYWPYLIKDEMQKREVMRWLEKSLKEQAAYGEEQRKTLEAGRQATGKEDIAKAILKYFEGRNVPEAGAPQYLQGMGLLPEGVTVPPNVDQQIAEANAALAQLVKYQMAGEIPPQEVVDKVSKFFGEKTLSGAAGEIIKQREGAAERVIRGREVAVQEALVPVRKGELGIRLKELAGQIGDMTAKEARETLAKLGTERRRFQAMVETKMGDYGDVLEEGQLNQIKSNIREIKQLEDKINKKSLAGADAEYKAIAQDLKAKGYTAADLDTDEKIRGILMERGYNIQELKKYMR